MSNTDHRNKDPITDEPGSHPIGTGLGAGGGALTGAAIGAVGGPIGAAAGAVVGAVLGGLAGHGAAEAISPTEAVSDTNEPSRETHETEDDASKVAAARLGDAG